MGGLVLRSGFRAQSLRSGIKGWGIWDLGIYALGVDVWIQGHRFGVGVGDSRIPYQMLSHGSGFRI